MHANVLLPTAQAHQYRCEHFAATRKCLCRNVKRAMYEYSWEPVTLFLFSIGATDLTYGEPMPPLCCAGICVSCYTRSNSFVPFRTDSFMCLLVSATVCLFATLFACVVYCVFGFTSVYLTHNSFPLAQHMHMQSHHRKVIWCRVDWGDSKESRHRWEFRSCAYASLSLSFWFSLCVRQYAEPERIKILFEQSMLYLCT